MHSRWTVLVLCLSVLVASMFAGCLSGGQVTAQQAQRAADPVARDWDERSGLVFAAGMEGRITHEVLRGLLEGDHMEGFGFAAIDMGEGGSLWERIERDPNPGNGKAEFWLLHYALGDTGRELVVVVDKNDEVLHQQEHNGTMHDAPIGEYAVDSDEAMRIAKRANHELRDMMGAVNLLVGSGLVVDPLRGGPVWSISAVGGDLQGVRGAWVQVDAVTAEVLQNEQSSML